MSQVSLHQITKNFGATEVLHGVSLDIQDGEFLTLVGPSGCGKSTLLRIIAGLERQTGGSVRIGERSVDHLRPRDRDLAMVFQSYALYPHLNVFDNIAVPLRMRRLGFHHRLPLIGRVMPGRAANERAIAEEVRSVADTLDIGHLLDRKPGQLSGGQRQRVAVGRAMVRRPVAFLMDEPLSNLDAKLRVHMRAEIAQLHRRLGVTFIYVTHDQAEAMTMSDRVAVMMDGDLLQVATPDDIYRNPLDIRVAEFIGSPKINIFNAVVVDHKTINIVGMPVPIETALAPGTHLQAGIRPEALHVTEPVAEQPKAVVIHTENLGSDALVHLEHPDSTSPVIARISPDALHQARMGDHVGMAFEAGHALLFDADGGRVSANIVPTEYSPRAPKELS